MTTVPKTSRRYRSALLAHLEAGPQASLTAVRGLGIRSLAAGMPILGLARLHEQTLLADVLPGIPDGRRPALIRQAAVFFATAITPVRQTRRAASGRTARIGAVIETLSQRTVELAASNLELSREVAQRKTAEAALRTGELRYRQLLEQSDNQQAQARRLARELLSAQEDERKKISRDLHDVIAQTLTGINLRLTTLKHDAEIDTKRLERNIVLTQKLVERAVNIVHRFARELRPALLDDLGLIPALQALLKDLGAHAGLRTGLEADPGVERLDMAKRTVLFRVAQEAMTNVVRHAKAGQASIRISKQRGGYRMAISDDGCSFTVERALLARGGRRLGLLGMRERLAMVGGTFDVVSLAGQGTTVTAVVPSAGPGRGGR
jgi:signal transduction histidine kinase